MGSARGIDYGSGVYPNNVCNYLLNRDPLWYTFIPASEDEKLKYFWGRIERKLPERTKRIIELMFIDGLTFEQIGKILYTTSTCVRNTLWEIYYLIDEHGIIIHHMLQWSIQQGYTCRITNEVCKKALTNCSVRVVQDAVIPAILDGLYSGKPIRAIADELCICYSSLHKFYVACQKELQAAITSNCVKGVSA